MFYFNRTVGENVCRGECGKQLEDLRQKIRTLTTAAQLAAESHGLQVLALKEVKCRKVIFRERRKGKGKGSEKKREKEVEEDEGGGRGREKKIEVE